MIYIIGSSSCLVCTQFENDCLIISGRKELAVSVSFCGCKVDFNPFTVSGTYAAQVTVQGKQFLVSFLLNRFQGEGTCPCPLACHTKCLDLSFLRLLHNQQYHFLTGLLNSFYLIALFHCQGRMKRDRAIFCQAPNVQNINVYQIFKSDSNIFQFCWH